MVGATTVLIDLVVYSSLHLAGVPLTPAKSVSFLVATVFAYLLNRSFTFGARGGRRPALLFIGLYACTLVVNVAVNALGLHVLPAGRFHILAAFLVAQLVSSTINFVGMRSVVFAAKGAV